MAEKCVGIKDDGSRCGNWPRKGGTTCGYHGGSAPHVLAANAQRQARAAACTELEHMGIPLVGTDPTEALLGQVAEAAGNVAYLRERVSNLEAVYGPDHLGDGAPHVLATMYAQWCDRLARMCKLALDANVSERQVRIAESMGAQIVTVMQGIAAELGYADDPRFPEIAARHLRAVGE